MNCDIYTDGGSRILGEQKRHGGWGVWYIPSEKDPYGQYGPSGLNATNNAAELMAYIKAGHETLKQGFDTANFFMDSRYVMDNAQGALYKWQNNGFLTQKGTPVANQPLWVEIARIQDEMKARKIKTTYTWVKGDDSTEGNENADDLATAGLKYGHAQDVTEWGEVLEDFTDKVESLERNAIALAEAENPEAVVKPTKKVKVEDMNAFLCYNRLLDITHRPQATTIDGRTIYMTLQFATHSKTGEDEESSKKKKAEGKVRGLGMIDPDASGGLVLTRTPDERIDILRQYQSDIVRKDAEYPFLAQLDAFASKKNLQYMAETPMAKWFKRTHTSILSNDREKIFTYYLDVPRLSRIYIEGAMAKLDIIDKYEAGQMDAEDVQDITDLFTTLDKKGKVIGRKTNEFERLIIVPTTYQGKKMDVRLTQKMHMPEVGALNRMIKQDNDIKIMLVKYTKTPVSFRHAIIVESKDNIGIYCSDTSSIRLVP